MDKRILLLCISRTYDTCDKFGITVILLPQSFLVVYTGLNDKFRCKPMKIRQWTIVFMRALDMLLKENNQTKDIKGIV